VYRCKRRARQTVFACKVIDKRKLNIEIDNKDMLLEQLRKEIEILQHLQHPNIVRFEDVIETADKIFVVMELIQGGELFEYLLDRGPLAEDVALHVFRQVMGAITYMHDRGVVHRDLKAENLLLVDPAAEYPTVKLIDFGFSTILRHTLTGSFLGTGGYLAPEIRQQRMYSESVDIWAAGVLLYLLLSCRLPFNADVEVLPSNRAQVARKFELSFPEAVWKGKSDSVKDLLRRMLLTDPLKRFSAHQVIRHPWTLYGAAADARGPKGVREKARKQSEKAKATIPHLPTMAAASSRNALGGRGGHGASFENPQESSGYVSKTSSTHASTISGRGSDPARTPGPLTDKTGPSLVALPPGAPVRQSRQLPPSGKESRFQALSSPSTTPTYGSSPSSTTSSPSSSMAAALVLNADGNIRHVRSSANLDRLPTSGAATLSRTPPPVPPSPLRPAITVGGGSQAGHAKQRGNGPQKPVLVSYFPQTLHNSAAGDLSTTSNLSLKFSMQDKKPRAMEGERRVPEGIPVGRSGGSNGGMATRERESAVRIVGVGR
jgi:serine/threonine protein kinase